MKIFNKSFLSLFLITFVLFCVILLNTSSIFASETIKVKDYIKGKFPVIFNIYLSPLGELDEYEKEFIDLLQNLSEEEQKDLAKEVYNKGFTLEILEKVKKWEKSGKPSSQPLISRVTVIVDGLVSVKPATGIALNPTGTTAWVTEEVVDDGRLVRVDLASSTVTPVATGLNQPGQLVVSGTVAFVAGNIGDPVTLMRIDLNDGTVTPASNNLEGGLSGVAVNSALTQAYVVNCANGVLSRVDIDPSSSTFRQVTQVVSGLSGPRDIVIDSTETVVYVTEEDAGRLVQVNIDITSPDYRDITLIADGLGGPQGLILNQSGDLVYLAEQWSRELSVVDVDPDSAGYGEVITILDRLRPRDVALSPDERTAILADAEDGILVVDIDPGSPGFGQIIECLTPVPLNGARGLDLNGDETIAYVVSEFSGELSRVDIDLTSPTFGVVTTIADDLFILSDVDVNKAETFAYVTRGAGPGDPPTGRNIVTRVDLVTGKAVTVTDQLDQPTNIVLSQDEAEGYVVDRQQGVLFRVNLATGVVNPIVNGLANPFAVVINQAETFAYVTLCEFHPTSSVPGEIVQIDLTTGQVVTTFNGLVSPAGIWINASETRAYVMEFGPEGGCSGTLSVVDIDSTSPNYRTITRLLTELCGPHDIRFNAAESVAYVVEVDSRRLIRVDF
jgi:DNA-binding beta-propeller fold protein YncE